ncbi:hypothetical protein KC19_1G016700 [Ceratodon purpureus]|uniref:Uncharacterized protein n=1 Tax=Ceratodon purpureus TaxID=3225 RepID=A0A8T0J3B9_CERPU|nr:hypothetical protein KC19_1G016700 [Ceratodon purpureus]
MGYTTTFTGCFTITPPLEGAPKALLNGLCNTRRMAREMDPMYGIEGEYYVEGTQSAPGWQGDEKEGRVLDHNRPPRTQPSLNCDWKLSEDGAKLEWSGMEKFYGYTEWLRYIITRVVSQGTVLNGEVQFQGEQAEDKGVIRIIDNRIDVVADSGVPKLRLANAEIDFKPTAHRILQSLWHYRNHHGMVLGLPLKVDYYLSYIEDALDALPPREWVTGRDGDVTQAVYFSVLLNPELSDSDVTSVLSAYNHFFGIENPRELPEASTVRKYWKTSRFFVKKQSRSPWKSSPGEYCNSWMDLDLSLGLESSEFRSMYCFLEAHLYSHLNDV